jgi:hypothetical protein
MTAGDGELPWGPPDNEQPSLLAGQVLLDRSDEGALFLLTARMYSVGVELVFGLRLHPSTTVPDREAYPLWNAMLVGLELADGRRVVCTDYAYAAGRATEEGVVLTQRGGGGGGRSFEMTLWLAPAPPDGDLLLYTACEPLGFGEARHVIPADAVAAARAGVVELWPWEPEPDRPAPLPAPRPIPPGGWFEQTLGR